MKNVHRLIWSGLVINILLMLLLLARINQYHLRGSSIDWLDVMLSVYVVACMLLQLMGLAMLIRGWRAGCVVGLIGAVFFAPVGLVCACGFIRSRNQLDQLPHALSDSGSVGAKAPLIRYAFENKTLKWFWVISIANASSVYLYSYAHNFIFSASWNLFVDTVVITSILMSVRSIYGYVRTDSFPVFALYDDHLEYTASLFSDPRHIPYTDIISADMKSRICAIVKTRQPDGSIDDETMVPFWFIEESDRDQAREEFRRKMEELGKSDRESAPGQPHEEQKIDAPEKTDGESTRSQPHEKTPSVHRRTIKIIFISSSLLLALSVFLLFLTHSGGDHKEPMFRNTKVGDADLINSLPDKSRIRNVVAVQLSLEADKARDFAFWEEYFVTLQEKEKSFMDACDSGEIKTAFEKLRVVLGSLELIWEFGGQYGEEIPEKVKNHLRQAGVFPFDEGPRTVDLIAQFLSSGTESDRKQAAAMTAALLADIRKDTIEMLSRSINQYYEDRFRRFFDFVKCGPKRVCEEKKPEQEEK